MQTQNQQDQGQDYYYVRRNETSFQNEENEISRVFLIENQEFTYNGPSSYLVLELLAILEKMETEDQKKQNKRHEGIILMLNDISKKILFEFIILKNEIKFDVKQLIITIVYWSVFIYMLIESINLKNEETFENHYQRNQLITYLPLITFLYTFGCWIFQHIENRIKWFILFIFMFLIPQFLLLDFYEDYIENNEESSNYIGITFCLLCLIIFLKSLFIFIMKTNFQRCSFLLTYPLINCGCYILSTVFIYFKGINMFIKISIFETNSEIIRLLLIEIQAPLFIFVISISALLLKNILKLNAEQVIEDLNQLSQFPISKSQFLQQRVIFLLTDYRLHDSIQINIQHIYISNLLFQSDILNIFFFLLQNPFFFFESVNIVYALLAFWLISMLTYLSVSFFQELESTNNNIEFVAFYLVILIAIPLYLFCGQLVLNTPLFSTQFRKLFLVTIICNCESLISLKLCNLLTKHEQLESIKRLIGIHQPAFFIFWLTISFFRSNQQIKKSFTTVFLLYFCAFPFFILQPVSEMMMNDNMKTASWVLIGQGLFPIVVYIQLVLLTLVCSWRKQEKFQVVDFECVNVFMLVVSVNQIAIFHMLAYINQLQIVERQQGMVIGFHIFSALIFICTLHVVYAVIMPHDLTNLKILRQFNLIKQVLKYGSLVSFLIFFVCFLTLTDEKNKMIMFVIAFGIPISMQYFKFLQAVSKKQTYAYAIYILLLFLLECFKILFVAVFLQIYIQDNNEDFYYYVSVLVRYAVFMFIIILAFIATNFQNDYLTIEFQEEIFKLLAEKNIILSKKVLKIFTLNQFSKGISHVIENDSEIAMLEYQTKDSQIFIYLFKSFIQYEFEIRNQVIEQKSKNIIKLSQQCLFCEQYQISFLKKTKAELQPINLKNEEEITIINQLYAQEEQMRLPQIQIIDYNQQKYLAQNNFLSNLLDRLKNLIQINKYEFINKHCFENHFQIDVQRNFTKYQKYQNVSKSIDEIYKEVFNKKRNSENENFNNTFSNYFAFITRIYDLLTLSSIPLSFLLQNSSEEDYFKLFLQFIEFSYITNILQIKLFLALSITFIQLLLGVMAIRQIYKKQYGKGIDNQDATYKECGYWFSKFIAVLSTQFIFVIKTFFQIFFCDLSNNPATLFFDPSVICMSDTHFNYVFLSVIGLLIYIPLSTFLYPLLQYEDKSTNLRFEPRYILVYMISKSIMAGIAIVAETKRSQLFILNLNFIFMLGLLFFQLDNPCKLLMFNLIESIILMQIISFYIAASFALEYGITKGLIALIVSTAIFQPLFNFVLRRRRNRRRVAMEI